ncbi:MAG: 3-isopropylmalate dehydratase small subunit [Verrucomicrobiaceae bacterium]|nr:3-isopropylmalate dehydratase small subunit [Verrucomicrobiaceae bacterium]
MLEKILNVKGKGVFVPGNDIDTDRIIPARFMVCITFEGLGKYAFYDERKNADGTDKVHPLTDPRKQNAKVLLSGANFGCGSSREHAPQSLWHYGFRAVVAESFAEIFFGNSTTLGIPCVCASAEDIAKIASVIEENPETEVDVDVDNLTVSAGNVSIKCTMPENARNALISGTWDPIAELIDAEATTAQTAEKLPYFEK